MAKDPNTATAATTATQEKPQNDTRETRTTVEVTAKGPAQMTFPELLGYIVTKVLQNRVLMAEAKKEMTIWYKAQDPNDLTTKKAARADLEYARGIFESTFGHFRELSFQELQETR